MKRFLILLSLLFCNTVCADTINLHWLNDDGTTYQNSTCTVDSDLNIPANPPTKYGYTFTGWKISTLYTPLQYLESTGTQYIDTNFIPTNNIKIEYKLKTLNTADKAETFIGTRLGNQGINKLIVLDHSNTDCKVSVGEKSILIPFVSQQVYIGVFDLIEKKTIINGIEYSLVNASFVKSTNNSLYLFATNGYGQNIYASKAQINYVKIYDNNTLVRDFIPVLDKDGVPCMFDKVEDKFYYNQGTGQFIAGPALQ